MVWWNIAYAFVMMIASYAISYYTTRKMQKGQQAQVGEMDIPTAEAGKTVPVVFGTILVKSSNVIDYFDPKTSEIKSESGGGK